jgi:isoleucyl-tRNA synthetase
VLHLVVERLAGLIAPVLCHMAEDIWQNLPYPVAEVSVFERGWPTVPESWAAPELLAPMQRILELRAQVNRVLEGCRGRGELGASLEAQVQLELVAPAADGAVEAASLPEALALVEASPHPEVDNLADWLLVSALRVGGPPPAETLLAETEEEGVRVRIARAAGTKCERCWHHESDIGQHPDHPSLCGRCVGVLERQGAGPA